MNRRNLTAAEIASSIGIAVPQMPPPPFGGRLGIKARTGQYIKPVENGHPICMAEKINAKRGRYTPHQGKRECERRKVAA